MSATRPEGRQLPPLRLAVPAVIAASALAYEIPRFVGLVGRDPAATDFRLFYVVAQAGLKWGWPHMYDNGRLHELSLAFGANGAAITPTYVYTNTPLMAWIIAPLTALPLVVALYIWTAFNIAALVAAWRMACPGKGFIRIVVLLVSLALWPTVLSLERGQPVLITYALAIGCWWMADRRQEVGAGILLALAWALKTQDVVLLPAILLIGGHRRAAAWWLATSAAMLAVFAIVIGANGIGTFLADSFWAASDPSTQATPLIAPFGPTASLLAGQVALGVVALAGAWRQRRSWRVAFAIGLLGTLVSAVHLHEYDYVGLVVAAWLALGEPTSALELAWLGLGAVCVQLPAIGIRLPILLWQPVWLVILSLRRTSTPGAAIQPAMERAGAQ